MPGVQAASPAGGERTVTSNFLKLGAGELVARVTGFLVLIYLARVLGAELYGLVGFVYAMILYFVTLTDFGVETLGPRAVVDRREDVARLASAVLTARALLGALLCAGIVLFALLALSDPDRGVLAWYGVILLATGGSARWVHLGLEQTGPVARARIAGEGLRALLTVLLVRGPADVLYVPLVHVLGEGLTAILLIASLRKQGIALRPRWDPAVALPVLRSGWPMTVTIALGMVLYNSDVLLLRGFRAASEVGLYLAAYTLITLLGNLSTSYSASLLPTLTRLGAASQRGLALYRVAIVQVLAASVPTAVGGFLLAPRLIDLVFGTAYRPAAAALQILVLTTPLTLVRMVQHATLYARGRQDRVMWATAAAALFNISVNLVVIPRFGMIGAATTTLLSETLRATLIQYFVLREGFGSAVLRGLWRPAAASVAMATLLLLLPFSSLWAGLLLGTGTYLLALLLCGGIELRDRRLPALRT
jgi:O-antigen/teichoic acid export membrane protein